MIAGVKARSWVRRCFKIDVCGQIVLFADIGLTSWKV